jgi:L-lactate dehydrogenase complex protein LldE
MHISLFIPCFVDMCYPKAAISIVQILEKLGHTIDFPEELACCGQPAFNSGYWDESRTVAVKVLDRLKDYDVVVIASGSCGAMIKNFYPEIFKGTPQEEDANILSGKIYEFTDFLVSKLGVTDLGAKFPARVTYHGGCHGLRELGLREQPRKLLEHVAGLELVEMNAVETCCCFGGSFSAKFPLISPARRSISERMSAYCVIFERLGSAIWIIAHESALRRSSSRSSR